MSDVRPLNEPADRPRKDDPAGADDNRQASPRRHWRLELLITVALGVAAIVSAFAAYKNEQRNHAATVHFSEGITNFDNAGQLFATANSTLSRDQSQFLAYAAALHDRKAALAEFIVRHLMDPRLQAAVAWWQSKANTGQQRPAPTPFTNRDPSYAIPEQHQAVQRTADSKRRFDQAKIEQENADHFQLIEVILATALFLYGIAGVTRNMTLKLGTLCTGGVIFLISLVLLITG
jgi:hypothetical protein